MIMDANGVPNVFLSGGSCPYIDDADRLRYVPDPAVDRVKVLSGNRYEHFEANAETTVIEDQEVRVFVWTRCTYVAE